jgi:hypothetical protein
MVVAFWGSACVCTCGRFACALQLRHVELDAVACFQHEREQDGIQREC